MAFLFAVNIRNLALEKVAEQIEFPCRFTGCTVFVTAGDKAKHEKFCDFRFASVYSAAVHICTTVLHLYL